jgi:hypothetical protein
MDKILQNEDKFVVYDNVLSQEEFKSTWEWFQNLEYTSINSTGFMKVWKLTDGNPMGSKEYNAKNYPFNNPLDKIYEKINVINNTHPEIFGEWKEVFLRAYIYGRGTKINWHNDPGYTAAVIFYVHPHWGAGWGGELMMAETPSVEYKKENVGGPLETWWTDRIMNYVACGYYVQPKPNRIVATRGGVWHQINRVDDDAGSNTRCSIVAFFR